VKLVVLASYAQFGVSAGRDGCLGGRNGIRNRPTTRGDLISWKAYTLIWVDGLSTN